MDTIVPFLILSVLYLQLFLAYYDVLPIDISPVLYKYSSVPCVEGHIGDTVCAYWNPLISPRDILLFLKVPDPFPTWVMDVEGDELLKLSAKCGVIHCIC